MWNDYRWATEPDRGKLKIKKEWNMSEFIHTGLTVEELGNHDGIIISGIDDPCNCHGFCLKLDCWEAEKLRDYITDMLEKRERFFVARESKASYEQDRYA
jgi:hypothetical protein